MEKAYCSRAVTSVGRNCRPCSAQDTGFHRRHVLGQVLGLSPARRLLRCCSGAPPVVPTRHGQSAGGRPRRPASSRRLLGVDVRQCLLAQPVDPLYRHPVVSLVRKRATGGPRVPPLFGRGFGGRQRSTTPLGSRLWHDKLRGLLCENTEPANTTETMARSAVRRPHTVWVMLRTASALRGNLGRAPWSRARSPLRLPQALRGDEDGMSGV